MSTEQTVSIVRCGLGEANVKMKLWVRHNSGLEFSDHTDEVSIRISAHVNSNRLTWEFADPIAIPPPIEDDPLDDLKKGIEDGAAAWDSTSISFVAPSTNAADIIVQIANECPADTIACIKGRELILSRGNEQLSHYTSGYMYFDNPPDWGSKGGEKKWTIDPSIVNIKDYVYLPGIAMHEFGHVAGLGHGADSNDIMGVWFLDQDKTQLTDDDKKAVGVIYNNHSKH